MMSDQLSITRKRCFNHVDREAAARCLDCGRFYCRECVTEHEDRVICASCMDKLKEFSKKKQDRMSIVITIARCSAGIIALWLFFYLLGHILLKIPVSFHDGTIWDFSW